MTRREKQVVFSGVVCFGLLLVFQVFVRPALDRVSTLRRVVTDKREILSDLQIKRKEYNSLRDRLEKIQMTIEQQQKNKKILSFIERIQIDCGLTQNVINMTPTTTIISDVYEKTNVEVKYGAVTLDQLIQFLLKIESSEMLIGIKSLEIKHSIQNPALLDAMIQLVSISNIE